MVIVGAANQNLHGQIQLYLLDAIKNGQLLPGDQVPSEWKLAELFGVSRMTARKALSELELRGYLHRQQGKGTFVALRKLEQPLVGLTSFRDDMRRRGLTPGTQVLSIGSMAAERRVSKALGLAEEACVYRLERLRLADGEPMALETSHIPTACAPDLPTSEMLTDSLYQLLAQRYAIRLTRATQILEAMVAGSREAELLQTREGTPLLRLERITRDELDRPVEYVQSLYRGDRYRFTTDLLR